MYRAHTYLPLRLILRSHIRFVFGASRRVMQLSALRYFLETVRLGSIRRAAETLYVAPSAVSRQIALLEQMFGMPLFERHSAGMRLTSAGEVFARQARATLRDFDRLHSEIDDLQKLRRGSVRIFSVAATVASVVYRAMAEFAREYPGITYEVQVTGGIRAIAALAAEECDIAISFEPPPHRDVEEVQSLRDPIFAVMHPAHPLASRAKVTLRDLAKHPVALLNDTHATRTLMDRALALEGLTLQTVLTVNEIGLALAFARSKLAITFAPSHVAHTDVDAGLLKAVLIDYPTLLSTRFVLCRHKSRPPTLPAQAFLISLRRQFTALEIELQKTRKRR
jgi:DNA-binding transcriptional LysR family regulator